MQQNNIIETENLTKIYNAHPAAFNLSLKVAKEGITGFLGRNGAGKSTTIKMLLGVVHPTSGTGKVLNHRITSPRESCAIRRRIAYVGESMPLYRSFTVEQLIRFTKSFYTDWRPDLERQFLKRFRLPMNRRVATLSKGMRAKLALLLALSRRPELIILDEPSDGLDPVSIEDFLYELKNLAKEGTTVFFSSHQISQVECIADRVCILDRGALIADLSLAMLRDNYRFVTCDFAAQPQRDAFLIPGVLKVEVTASTVRILASHSVDTILNHARSRGALSIVAEPVGLKELFISSVEEN
jgi:ABC-2 type transport system ATP-binding protein